MKFLNLFLAGIISGSILFGCSSPVKTVEGETKDERAACSLAKDFFIYWVDETFTFDDLKCGFSYQEVEDAVMVGIAVDENSPHFESFDDSNIEVDFLVTDSGAIVMGENSPYVFIKDGVTFRQVTPKEAEALGYGFNEIEKHYDISSPDGARSVYLEKEFDNSVERYVRQTVVLESVDTGDTTVIEELTFTPEEALERYSNELKDSDHKDISCSVSSVDFDEFAPVKWLDNNYFVVNRYLDNYECAGVFTETHLFDLGGEEIIKYSLLNWQFGDGVSVKAYDFTFAFPLDWKVLYDEHTQFGEGIGIYPSDDYSGGLTKGMSIVKKDISLESFMEDYQDLNGHDLENRGPMYFGDREGVHLVADTDDGSGDDVLFVEIVEGGEQAVIVFFNEWEPIHLGIVNSLWFSGMR